jgi:hypothetical protein
MERALGSPPRPEYENLPLEDLRRAIGREEAPGAERAED